MRIASSKLFATVAAAKKYSIILKTRESGGRSLGILQSPGRSFSVSGEREKNTEGMRRETGVLRPQKAFVPKKGGNGRWLLTRWRSRVLYLLLSIDKQSRIPRSEYLYLPLTEMFLHSTIRTPKTSNHYYPPLFACHRHSLGEPSCGDSVVKFCRRILSSSILDLNVQTDQCGYTRPEYTTSVGAATKRKAWICGGKGPYHYDCDKNPSCH